MLIFSILNGHQLTICWATQLWDMQDKNSSAQTNGNAVAPTWSPVSIHTNILTDMKVHWCPSTWDFGHSSLLFDPTKWRADTENHEVTNYKLETQSFLIQTLTAAFHSQLSGPVFATLYNVSESVPVLSRCTCGVTSSQSETSLSERSLLPPAKCEHSSAS